MVRGLRAVAGLLDRLREILDLVTAAMLPQHAVAEMIRAEWEGFGDATRESAPRLFAWEHDFYQRFLGPSTRVLVAGCGTGRDLIPLVEAGHSVDGLDIAPGAVAACRDNLRARGLQAVVHAASMESPPPIGPFDVVIFSWWCFGYLPGRGARSRALRAALAMLRPQGHVLISYLLPEAKTSRVGLLLSHLVGWLARAGWRVEQGDQVQLRGVRGSVRLHFEHRFTRAEIEAEARAAGFEIRTHEIDTFGRLALALPEPR